MFKERSLGDLSSAYNESIDRSMIRIEGMRKLIADLLDMTRIESGRKNRQLAAVNVREIAQYVLDSIKNQAAENKISLSLAPPTSISMQKADRAELEMVFNNLISQRGEVQPTRRSGGK